jgi:hypothetical protein
MTVQRSKRPRRAQAFSDHVARHLTADGCRYGRSKTK